MLSGDFVLAEVIKWPLGADADGDGKRNERANRGKGKRKSAGPQHTPIAGATHEGKQVYVDSQTGDPYVLKPDGGRDFFESKGAKSRSAIDPTDPEDARPRQRPGTVRQVKRPSKKRRTKSRGSYELTEGESKAAKSRVLRAKGQMDKYQKRADELRAELDTIESIRTGKPKNGGVPAERFKALKGLDPQGLDAQQKTVKGRYEANGRRLEAAQNEHRMATDRLKESTRLAEKLKPEDYAPKSPEVTTMPPQAEPDWDKPPKVNARAFRKTPGKMVRIRDRQTGKARVGVISGSTAASVWVKWPDGEGERYSASDFDMVAEVAGTKKDEWVVSEKNVFVVKKSTGPTSDAVSVPKPLKRPVINDPKGGLTAAGRKAFKEQTGANLKPGVKDYEGASLADKKRWISWASRFYGQTNYPPLVDDKGRPTRFALTAAAWGEPVPKTEAAARAIYQKAQRRKEEVARMVEKRDGKGDSMPNPKSSVKEIVGSHGHRPHGKSILWPALYEHLREKGMSKSKAAAISNGQWNKKHGMGAKNLKSTRVTKGGPYTKPSLRERIKDRLMRSSKGGDPGEWSARKSQLLAAEYEKAGGGYTGEKTEDQKSLTGWTEQKWRTSSGKPSEGKRRYLPDAAWGDLTDDQIKATNAKKAKGNRKGRQFVPNTAAAEEAAAQVRKTDTDVTDLEGRGLSRRAQRIADLMED